MKTRHQYINRNGEVVDLEDGAVVPDGFGIRVPAFLMDGVPTVDPKGQPAGLLHRPGFVHDADDDDARASHAAMVKRTEQAWRTITDNDPAWPAGYSRPHASRPPDITTPTSSAREEYITRVQNAWRTIPEPPTSTANRLPRLGGWRDTNPSPKPPDVSLDAAPPNADAAYAEMVERTSNAWRTL